MNHAPLLSVVVPVFGVEKYLVDCLRSILAQPLMLEVIVVNDASPDASRAIAASFARLDDRVRIIDHPQNRGLGAARNSGLWAARGTYIAFPDSDDLVAPNAYRRMVDLLEESGSDIATGPAEEFGTGGRKRYWTTAGQPFLEPITATTLRETPALALDHTAWTKVFRRALLTDSDLRWPERTKCEDVAMTMAAYARASTIDITDQPVYFYRRRSGSISTTLDEDLAVMDWVSQTAIAFNHLRSTEHTASASIFAALRITAEYPSRFSAFANGSTGSSPESRKLAFSLLSATPATDLHQLSPATRWSVFLILAGRTDLIPLVQGWSTPPVAAVPSGDLECPPALRTALGVDGVGLWDAFRSRFLPHPPIESPASDTRSATVGPDISVIVPTFNVGPWIDECLRSIRAAEDVTLEIICVDDGSRDDTWRILQEHQAQDNRVRALRSSGKGGGQARNLGVDLATGRYLAFADGDDVVPPRAYRSMLDAARATRADIVTGSFLKFGSTSTWDTTIHNGYNVRMDGIPLASYPAMLANRTCWNRLARREAWNSSGMPFPSVPRANDIVPLTSVLTGVERITVLPTITYLYRDRPGGGSMTAGLGSATSTLSYFDQELTCLHLVAQLEDAGATASFWKIVMERDGWGTLLKFLDDPGTDAEAIAEVSRAVDALHSLAPGYDSLGLHPDVQAAFALVRSGGLKAAGKFGHHWRKPTSPDPETGLDLLKEAANTGLVGDDALRRLLWTRLIRPLVRARSLPIEVADRAIAVVKDLAEQGIVAATVPYGREHLIAQVLRHGPAEELVERLSPLPALPITLHSAGALLTMSGPLDEWGSAPCSVTADTKLHGDHITTLLAQPVIVGSEWRATIDTNDLPTPARWRLQLEYDVYGAIQHRRPTADGRTLISMNRLSRLKHVQSSVSDGVTITLRAPIVQRVRRLVGTSMRHLARKVEG